MRPLPRLTGQFTSLVIGLAFAFGFVAGPTVPAGIALAQAPPNVAQLGNIDDVPMPGALGADAAVPTAGSAVVVAPSGAVLVLARGDGTGGAPLSLAPRKSGFPDPPEPPEPRFDDAPLPAAAPPSAPPSAAYQPNDPAAPAPNGVQVSAAGKQALDAVLAAVKSDASGRLLAIMAAVSAGLWFLILMLRRFGGTLVSGGAVRAFTIFGGAVASVCGYFGAGLTWPEALQVFMAGPGALAFNEIVRIMGDPSKPKQV